MITEDYAVTFACYNQLDYTRRCVESLVASGIDLGRVIAVDNGSTDDTRAYLASLNLGGRIFNKDNLGCGVAWNQGALLLQSEWTVIMNNDVVVTQSWLEAMINAARRNQLRIVCPALIEGDLDYDLAAFSADASSRMKDALRIGIDAGHAVCLAVHASVWMEVGYFRPTPKLFGFEDTLFFNDVRKAAIRTGMTGASWLHHYGSITQKAMKQEKRLAAREGLGGRDNKDLLEQTWIERKINKMRKLNRRRRWRREELAAYRMTMHGLRETGQFRWL